MADVVFEVLNQLVNHDDLPANQRTASTIMPGIKRAFKSLYNDTSSPIAMMVIAIPGGYLEAEMPDDQKRSI